MSKITLNRISSLINAPTTLNGIISQIESAFDRTLFLDGTAPNQMSSSLDMNSHRVLNLPAPININEPARMTDVNNLLALVKGTIPTGGGVIPAAAIGGLAPSATIDTTNASNITTGVLPVSTLSALFAGINSWSDKQTIGLGTYFPTPNYPGSISGTLLLVVNGSMSSPTTQRAPATVIQKNSNYTTPGLNITTYSSTRKYSSTSGTSVTASFNEAVDMVGGAGSFVEGLRSHGGVFGGSNGSSYGHVSVAWSASPAASAMYLVGVESSVISQVGTDAAVFTSFDPTSFKASYVASSQGTLKVDSAFVTNFFNTKPFRTGILILGNDGAGHISVDDTGFATKYLLNVGIDLSQGTYTTAALKFPNGNIDGSGNITAPKAILNTLSTAAPVTVGTTTYTVGATNSDIIFNASGSVTLTLPAAASFIGRNITVKTITAQALVSASSNVVPSVGGAAGTAILAATAGKWARLVSDGTNWIVMESN